MANGEAKWQTRGYLSVNQSTVLSRRIARGEVGGREEGSDSRSLSLAA